jgi:hypothetical protein
MLREQLEETTTADSSELNKQLAAYREQLKKHD